MTCMGSTFCYIVNLVIIFFVKQKTAYEMCISDLSSDVCSSDLGAAQRPCRIPAGARLFPVPLPQARPGQQGAVVRHCLRRHCFWPVLLPLGDRKRVV